MPEPTAIARRRKPSYWVTTWDCNLQAFTPQAGVRTGPWTLWGLRRAFRALRAMGYPCRRGDPAVAVDRYYDRKD
jgi:hypothetical protein